MSPAPESEHAAPSKRALWKWSAALTVFILVLLMRRCGSTLLQGRKLADASVRHFHERRNAGDYENIYGEAGDGFRAGQSHDDSIRFLETVHKKLGLAGPGTQLNVRVDTNTHGTFLTTQYSTAFAAGTATEVFTWMQNGSTLRLYAYHIQSNTLILDKPAAQNGNAVK
jgi:hypothetical protein